MNRVRMIVDEMTSGDWWISQEDGRIYSGEAGPNAVEVGGVDMKDSDLIGLLALKEAAPKLLDLIESMEKQIQTLAATIEEYLRK
jgi:hypothetical protein